MAQFKWYDIFVDLFGTILSFADPITDILTLVEFYRADHKTWFVVGLCFIILPLVFFSVINFSQQSRCGRCITCIFGCSPFFPAFMKLRTLFVHLKKLPNLWRGNQIEPTDINENPLTNLDNLLDISAFAVLAEAAFESAPQFIIQLYAMAVQQESVTIVQMASLPVSFLSLASASTVADRTKLLQRDGRDLNLSVKDKVLLFVTHLFILSSRLFAVALFTVSYKWWVISVLILHCTVIMICEIIWSCWTSEIGDCNVYGLLLLCFTFCFLWLRDDWSPSRLGGRSRAKQLRGLTLSNVLFVIENITMILLFYFSHFPHTWFSLPVTICVCLFAVLGAVMRLTHFCFSNKESDNDV
ncbi:unnamed protein product [Porites evermanni]|uniref:XK-related protein n=1 Tax=Porites evermanni TaxID=104178 RepID=A0ABN8QZZ8_9CNID|nr:unnamed protein product [Porites evermanni]